MQYDTVLARFALNAILDSMALTIEQLQNGSNV